MELNLSTMEGINLVYWKRLIFEDMLFQMLEINDNFSNWTANYVRENSRVETVLKTRQQKLFWKAFFAIYFMTDLLCQDVGLEIS